MFDLSDKIESEVVDGIVSTISNPQMMIDEPVNFIAVFWAQCLKTRN